MPPAAQFEFASYIEEPYDSVQDVGGIEVEALSDVKGVHLVTRIWMLPRDHALDERKRSDDARFSYFMSRNEKCLADSFDSVDEIVENSNEERLLRTLAARATVVPYSLDSGLGEPVEYPYSIESTEGKYLDVLDRHLQETDPHSKSFSQLDCGPDDAHPKKNGPSMDEIMEHFLDIPCCKCNPLDTPRTYRSALRPSRWTNLSGTPVNRPYRKSSGSVKFKAVDIREFKMTLGNHPSATSGPPVMIDYDNRLNQKVVDLETYEKTRSPRRNRRQLKLSLQQRHNILVKENGFSFEDVKGAWHDALEIRKQRKETLERGLALMKWDEVWESTCRKFSRLSNGS